MHSIESSKYKDYVIYSDYDGTLTDTPNHLDERNLKAIELFRKGGGIFGIASGRSFARIEDIAQLVNAPCILHNGAVIYDPLEKKYLKQHFVEDDVLNLLKDVHAHFPNMGAVIVSGDYLWWLSRKGPYTNIKPDEFDREITLQSAEKLKGSMISAALNGTLQEVEEASIFIQKYWPQFYAVSSYPGILDITNQNISKGQCLQELKAGWFSRKHIIAVGDGDNDLDMLKVADTGIAAGEASDTVKEQTDMMLPKGTHAIETIIEWIDNRTIRR